MREVPITSQSEGFGPSKIGRRSITAIWQRLEILALGAMPAGRAMRFVLVGFVGMLADLLIFRTLFLLGAGLTLAQVLSFALVSLCSYGLNARRALSAVEGAQPSLRPARALVVGLLVLSLRGGALACLMRLTDLPVEAAMLFVIAATAVASTLGAAFFVFPAEASQADRAAPWRIAALGVAFYALLLRLLFLGLPDLLPQEAYYWDYAQHLDIGYLDHPPMVAWLIWLGTALFGDTAFGVRIAAWLGWGVTAFFSFRLARDLFGRAAGFASLLLVAALPFFFATGLVMTPDAPLTACWAGALAFLHRALRGGSGRAWWGVGACIGLGMLSKYTIALLVPATLLFMLVEPRARVWFRRPEPYLAAVLALVIFSPVILWNLENGLASFAFQSTRRIEGVVRFSLPELVLSLAALLTPTGLIAALMALWPRRRPPGTRHEDGREQWRFIACFTLVPLAVFASFSLFHMARLNWTGPLWLAVLPAIAAGIVAPGAPASAWQERTRRAWPATLAVCLVIYGLGLNSLAAGLPGLARVAPFPAVPIAWRAFGREAAAIAGDVRQATGQEPLLVGLDAYNIASELAFYGKGEAGGRGNSVGRAVLGQSALMYGYWYPPETLPGQPAVLFAFTRRQIDNPFVAAHFRATGEVMQRDVVTNGRVEGHFYYRTGYIRP